MKKRYCGEADFWRLVFSVMLVLFHGTEGFAGPEEPGLFRAGALGVDFFLLMSGYFMMASAHRADEKHTGQSIGRETAAFLWHKVQGFLGMYLLCMAVSYGVWAYVGLRKGVGLGNLLEQGAMSLWNLLLLSGSGMKFHSVNGSIWYLSSMLFAMGVLYPIRRRWRDGYRCLVAPGVVFLLLGYLSQVHGGLRSPKTYLPLGLTAGTCRAILEISMGSLVYDGAAALGRLPLTKLSRALLSAIKLGSFGAALGLMQRNCLGNRQLDFTVLLLLAVGLTIVFSGQGLFGALFRSPRWRLCAGYSLAIYLSQISVRMVMLDWELAFWPKEGIYLLSCLALAALLMGVEGVCKALWARHGGHVQGWFLRS